MKRRSDVVAYTIAGAAIFAFVLLLIFALVRLTHTDSNIREDEGDNMLWVISRAQLATLRLDTTIARQVGVEDNPAALKRSYDILLSRLTLLTSGPQFRYIENLGFGETLVAADQAIRAIETDILGLAHGDNDTARAIHATLAPLARDLGRAGNRAMVLHWKAAGARLDSRRASITQVVISIFGIIIIGGGLSVFMLRAMTQRQHLMRSIIREQETAAAYRSFIALASHQFRTPLAVIDSSMQRLLRSGANMSLPEIEERAKNVRMEVQSLNQLLSATLDVLKLDAGQVSANPSTCHVSALIDCVRERQLKSTPNRVITTHIDATVPATLETDPLLAEQILANLVSNAIKYSAASEPVSIHVSTENQQLLIAVEDHGVGIPDKEQQHLFEPFFRSSTTQDVPGTGVGLSSAAQLAQLLNGELSFVSQTGLGTTFVLKLPLVWKRHNA